jgi:SAM-dependent methyltransferase
VEEVNCALCGATDKILNFKTAGGNFLARCIHCDFQFYSPRPSAKKIEAYYHEDEFYKKVNVTSIETVVSLLAGHHPGKLLDVGCGVGRLVSVMQKKGWDAVGIEPSSKAVEIAKKELDLTIQQTYLSETTFKPDTFDVVVLLAVLEHAFDPVELMEKAWKLLKPGGCVIFSTPNLDSLPYLLLENKSEFSWFIREHINQFTLRTLRYLLKKVGFLDPSFYACAHFIIEGKENDIKLLPSINFTEISKKIFSQILDRSAKKAFSKGIEDLVEAEVNSLMLHHLISWGIKEGEYGITPAVYGKASKRDKKKSKN